MSYNKMRCIAVTGASSMLGVALIKQCIQNNVHVVALLRSKTKRIDRLPKSDLVTIINCDFEEFETININFLDIDTFYHIGWAYTEKDNRNSPELQEQNIKYTLNVVRFAQKNGCKRFIGIGSQAEYGRVNSIISPKTPVNPETAYGVAKYAAGKLSQLECEKLGIEYIWVRVFSVYGVNDSDGTLLYNFISKAHANETMQLTKCEQIWDFLYEDDAGSALYLLGTKGISGKVYCLGSGEGRTLLDFLEKAKNVVNHKYNLCVGKLPYTEKQVMYLCADISDLKIDLNWSPQIDFISGIRNIYKSRFSC